MIIRFPGYLHPEKNSFWHAGKHYRDLKTMLRDLTEDEIAKMTAWHLKRGLGRQLAGSTAPQSEAEAGMTVFRRSRRTMAAEQMQQPVAILNNSDRQIELSR